MDVVTVSVQLFGELSCYGKDPHQTGKYSTVDVKLSEGSTLKDLLDYLLICTNERGFTFINGLISAIPNRQMDLKYVLNDGDQILFFPYKMLPSALHFDMKVTDQIDMKVTNQMPRFYLRVDEDLNLYYE